MGHFGAAMVGDELKTGSSKNFQQFETGFQILVFAFELN